MIHIRFNQINSLSNKDEDTFIMRGKCEYVPSIGEVVSLKGEPYIVHERSWAFGDEAEVLNQHCYIRVLPRPSTQR